MLIKIGNEYLDFNDSIEIERQIKLFEDMETTNGDFSYQFSAPMTANNIRVLQNPFPDNKRKIVYEKTDCSLLDDEGNQLYFGSLRVERVTEEFELSFFAGNNNWFGLLSGPITDIDFSDLDLDQNATSINAQNPAVEGIVFSLVDNGVLVTRGYRHITVEDYVAGIYVHTVFKRIFQHHSIKLEGDLFKEPLYWKLITQRNNKSQADIDAASSYAEQSTLQARAVENTEYEVVFQNDSTYPFYDGSLNPFTLPSSYTAPYEMKVRIEASFVPAIVDASYNQRIYIYINGAFTFVDIGLDVGGLYNSATPGDQDTFTIDRTITLQEGDVLTLKTEWQHSAGSTQNDVVSGWVKITPIYIYKVFGNSVVPQWSQQQFVSNIFKIFNILPHYNAFTKTLTLNVFDNIRDKEPIDLSDYISRTEVDYVDFISNYGKRNLLSYQEVDFDNLKDYNIQNFFKYGQGVVTADNDFLKDSEDLIESDFSHPQSYLNPVFDMSMERLNLVQFETTDSTTLTAVNDSSGVARFVIEEDHFLVGDMARIESTNPFYNKDWVVDTVTVETSPGAGDGYITLFGLPYDTAATGTITKLIHKYNESDDVYLLVQIPSYTVSKFSGFTSFRFDGSNRTVFSLAYFNLLDTGRQINDDYKQSLSFGEIESPFFYQRTIVETYWQLVQGIFDDPVKLISAAYMPNKVFLQLDFLQPITVRTLETFNRYYLNKITGYEGNDCILEMIKLATLSRGPLVIEDDGEGPQILQAIQAGIINGNVIDLNFPSPMTDGSKILFVCCNVANGTISAPTISETGGNINMANTIDRDEYMMKEPAGVNNIGSVFFEVIDISDPDPDFQFTFATPDILTHYTAGFAIEIAPGAEWDNTYLGFTDSALGYNNSGGQPIFTTGISLSSVPNVITPQARNLFIPWGFSMGLSPGGNAFQAPFGGLNPSGSVNPAGVLMGFAWNAVSIPTASDNGPLVFDTSTGISGVRQWLSWGNFYIP